MNILQICSGTLTNGAIIHALLLSRELARRGHRVTMVCRPKSWLGEQLAGGAVEIVESTLKRWPPGELRRVATLARQRQVDVIHSHMSSAHFFGILLRWMTGVASVATAQSRHFQLHWMFNDYVIAVSEATRQYICRRNFVRPSRSATIHNFVDCPKIYAVPAEARQAVRRELHIPDDALLVGAVGDIFPRKGQMYLVEAMAEVCHRVPQARLLVVGPPKDAQYAAAVAARAEQLGIAAQITWAGERGDVCRILRALDLKVLASLEESLPLSILEAMAAGLPVVATSAGGNAECVRHAQTGLIVPPADAPALADAITMLLTDAAQRQRFGLAAQACIRDHFSPESQTAAIEAVYAQVARGRRRRAA